MDFKLFKQALSHLNWRLDYFEFCEQILGKKQQRNILLRDNYSLKKWEHWQLLNKTLNSFNEDALERMISTYESTAAKQ